MLNEKKKDDPWIPYSWMRIAIWLPSLKRITIHEIIMSHSPRKEIIRDINAFQILYAIEGNKGMDYINDFVENDVYEKIPGNEATMPFYQ